MPTKYDLAIIGSGGGAFAAAIRATTLGKSVVMIERGTFGGIFGILISLGLYFAFDWCALIAENAEISFGDVVIALPHEVTVETVFERNPHGNFVLRIHAEWPEFEAARAPRPGRSPAPLLPGAHAVGLSSPQPGRPADVVPGRFCGPAPDVYAGAYRRPPVVVPCLRADSTEGSP